MDSYLARPELTLSKASQNQIKTEILTVLNHPEFDFLFGPGSQAEVPIVGTVGTYKKNLVSGQIDRILVSKNSVTIVDFKTNQVIPESETKVAEVYLRQMAAYRALLRLIYPNHKIVAVLLWTNGPKLMRLSDRTLDIHAP